MSYEKSPEEKAEDIYHQLSCAVGEIAYDAVNGINIGGYEIPDCMDKEGALADNLYNDKRVIQGLLGDYIYDRAPSNKLERIEIAKALMKKGHDAVKVVAEQLVESWNEVVSARIIRMDKEVE